jgi:hypothetical protein
MFSMHNISKLKLENYEKENKTNKRHSFPTHRAENMHEPHNRALLSMSKSKLDGLYLLFS